jgi:hypothetical protein
MNQMAGNPEMAVIAASIKISNGQGLPVFLTEQQMPLETPLTFINFRQPA